MYNLAPPEHKGSQNESMPVLGAPGLPPDTKYTNPGPATIGDDTPAQVSSESLSQSMPPGQSLTLTTLSPLLLNPNHEREKPSPPSVTGSQLEEKSLNDILVEVAWSLKLVEEAVAGKDLPFLELPISGLLGVVEALIVSMHLRIVALLCSTWSTLWKLRMLKKPKKLKRISVKS